MNRFLNILIPMILLGIVGYELGFDRSFANPVKSENLEKLIYIPAKVDLQLEVVNTPEAMAKGLQGRDNLKAGTGMLFVFPDAGKTRCMWNKGVKFPVAVAFFNAEGQLINDTVMPANSLKKVCSFAPAKFAVEANPT